MILSYGATLCIVGYLEASLPLPGASSAHLLMIIKMSPTLQVSPKGTVTPWNH